MQISPFYHNSDNAHGDAGDDKGSFHLCACMCVYNFNYMYSVLEGEHCRLKTADFSL